MSTRRAMETASRASQPRDGDGNPLCRWCRGPIKRPRRTFCSAACVEEWRIRTQPAYLRHRTEQRDHGVCARCGLDTAALKAELKTLLRCWKKAGHPKQHPYRDRMQALGLRDVTSALWEAHHVTAVIEGGGECGLDGIETLCRWCHRRETAELAARRAGRAPQARLPLGHPQP